MLKQHIFVSFQNGVGSKGEKSTTSRTYSTIVEYDNHGEIVNQWNVTGKCDGLTADPANNSILATVNEDGNSSMYIIHLNAPKDRQVEHLFYRGLQHGGGTDSISVQNVTIYIMHRIYLPIRKYGHPPPVVGEKQRGESVRVSCVVEYCLPFSRN